MNQDDCLSLHLAWLESGLVQKNLGMWAVIHLHRRLRLWTFSGLRKCWLGQPLPSIAPDWLPAPAAADVLGKAMTAILDLANLCGAIDA